MTQNFEHSLTLHRQQNLPNGQQAGSLCLVTYFKERNHFVILCLILMSQNSSLLVPLGN